MAFAIATKSWTKFVTWGDIELLRSSEGLFLHSMKRGEDIGGLSGGRVQAYWNATYCTSFPLLPSFGSTGPGGLDLVYPEIVWGRSSCRPCYVLRTYGLLRSRSHCYTRVEVLVGAKRPSTLVSRGGHSRLWLRSRCDLPRLSLRQGGLLLSIGFGCFRNQLRAFLNQGLDKVNLYRHLSTFLKVSLGLFDNAWILRKHFISRSGDFLRLDMGYLHPCRLDPVFNEVLGKPSGFGHDRSTFACLGLFGEETDFPRHNCFDSLLSLSHR